jgi:signal peptidase I
MQPTYHAGQRLFINRIVYARVDLTWLGHLLPFVGGEDGTAYVFHAPRRAEVVVLRAPSGGDDLIKRVVGVPGDRISVLNGRVLVNGRALAEPYLRSPQTICASRWCDVTLGPDEYYVLGDNRAQSSDSRLFGPVGGDRIIGKAWLIFSPLHDIGFAR